MLSGQTIDVPIKPGNQQKPSTSALTGQLRYVKNGIATKYTRPTQQGESTQLRISKRNGFRQQPISNYSPVSGIPVATNLTGFADTPTLYSSLADEQVVIADSFPYVLSENSETWSKFTYVCPVQSLSKHVVYTGTTQYGAFDSANVGDVFCYVWQDLYINQNYFYLVDKDGTPIRLPVKSDGTLATIPSSASAKVVSDGVNFWIIYHTPGVLRAMLVSPHGVVLDNDQIGTFTEGGEGQWPGHFDVTYQHGQVLVAKTNVATVTVIQLSGTASISQTSTNLFDELADVGLAWAENVSGDGFVYLQTAHFNPDVTSVEYLHKQDYSAGAPTTAQTWLTFDEDGNGGSIGHLVSMSGAMCSDGAFYGNLSFRFANIQQCVTQTFIADAGGAVLHPGQHRQTVAGGRTFQLDGRQHAVLFYPSATALSYTDPLTGKLTSGFSQPTYFFVDLITRQVSGRFEYANAGGYWLFDGDTFGSVMGQGQFYFHLPSSFVDSELVTHRGLGYLATTVETSTSARIQAINASLTQDIITPLTVPSAFVALTQFQQTATVGLADYRLGVTGQAFEFGGELFIPGAIGKSFGGAVFSENGLNLQPEQPLSISQSAGGQLTLLGMYSYVLVWEWTDPNGKRHRSAPAAAFTVTLTGANNRITLQGLPLSMTSHPDVTLGVYRTWMVGITPTTQFRKVSNDLAPTLNHPGDQTWTFVDDASDVQASVGELLYAGTGGQGMLSRDPCPAFSEGCVFQDRVFVIGWDGRIWYSAEFDDSGEATWFNQDVMVISLPGDDSAVKVTPVDGRIIISGNTGFWELDGRGFADPNGEVSVIAPQRLPVNMGGTKYSCVSEKGVVFQSTINGVEGGLYILGRGLVTDQYSNDVQDQLDGRTVVGLTVDELNRLYCLVAATETEPATMFVYDQNAEIWATYLLTSDAVLVHRKLGKVSYVDAFQCMAQDSDNLFTDAYDFSGLEPVPYELDIQVEYVALGGIKNFKRCWGYIASGEFKGSHNLNVTAIADSNGTLVTTHWTVTPSVNELYQFSFLPTVEEASRVSFRFQDDYTNVPDPGDTFTLELLSFYVAIEKGLSRLPIQAQIAATPAIDRPFAEYRAKLLAGINSTSDILIDTFTVAPGAFGSVWTVAATGTGSVASLASAGVARIRSVGTPASGELRITATLFAMPDVLTTKYYGCAEVKWESTPTAFPSIDMLAGIVGTGTYREIGYDVSVSPSKFFLASPSGSVVMATTVANSYHLFETWSKGDGWTYGCIDRGIPFRIANVETGPLNVTHPFFQVDSPSATGQVSSMLIRNCIFVR